ncbi:MAG TPA: nitrous oxide-stimulated promoter family protein [Desulfuromonas sp.]|nr:nitrous oxide-stimulated promoter family protein [Desulfuromonas sp.]HBT82313.1 nitrous oxide-stimulated promoter family protein [Desulfuromonas sp.]
MTISRPKPELTSRESKDLNLLALFTAIYCRAHHPEPRAPLESAALIGSGVERHQLCASCRELLRYASERRIKCPLEPKPTCKHCPVHCYRSDYRAKVREIMRFSGRRLILRGRMDLFWRYFF